MGREFKYAVIVFFGIRINVRSVIIGITDSERLNFGMLNNRNA